jgi:ABC-2 type transport system ATP-binding protein
MRTLHVDGVVKRYGDFLAVDHVSFTAEPGRILGVLGPNGAGKSSTIRMVTHITLPDEGQITFGAQPVGPWSQEVMGYLPEERGLYKKLKVGEQIVYFAQLRGLDRAEATRRMRAWLERLGARDWEGKKVEELSKGMAQKVQFVSTLVHEPELVILDEPFSGLDPINADLLKDVVYSLREEGRTVLFASHRMEQVEELCDDICLINRGKVVLAGGVREVKRSFGRETVLLEYEGDDAWLDTLAAQGAVRIDDRTHGRATVHLEDGTPGRRVLETALAHVDTLYRFHMAEPSLREIFVRTVGETNLKASPAPAPILS